MITQLAKIVKDYEHSRLTEEAITEAIFFGDIRIPLSSSNAIGGGCLSQ